MSLYDDLIKVARQVREYAAIRHCERGDRLFQLSSQFSGASRLGNKSVTNNKHRFVSCRGYSDAWSR